MGKQEGYHNYNAHGDVVQLTNGSGTVTKNYTYDAFGVEKNAATSDANPFRYCGEQYDDETGNYYLRARYYTPGVGRFTQEDPVMDGLNWYTYCAGNPVRFVDPHGLVPYAATQQNYTISPDGTQWTPVIIPSKTNLVQRNESPGYNREVAIAYAHRWWDSQNPEFYSYLHGDCANFVSQALYYGGLEMTDEWYSYKSGKDSLDIESIVKSIICDKYHYNWDVGDPWKIATKQYEYFSDAKNGYINGEVICISNVSEIANASYNFGIQPGDLMYFSHGVDSAPYHATIIDKVGGGKIYYSGHTRSRQYQDLEKSLGDAVVFIVRVKDYAN